MTFSSYCRLLAILALAVVIEGKLLHCAAEDAAATGLLTRARIQRTADSECPSLPDCGDESGCICRGATLISVFEPESPEGFSVAAFCECEFSSTARTVTVSAAADGFQPPQAILFGRRLRAQLASFVI